VVVWRWWSRGAGGVWKRGLDRLAPLRRRRGARRLIATSLRPPGLPRRLSPAATTPRPPAPAPAPAPGSPTAEAKTTASFPIQKPLTPRRAQPESDDKLPPSLVPLPLARTISSSPFLFVPSFLYLFRPLALSRRAFSFARTYVAPPSAPFAPTAALPTFDQAPFPRSFQAFMSASPAPFHSAPPQRPAATTPNLPLRRDAREYAISGINVASPALRAHCRLSFRLRTHLSLVGR
jgi:hypothetical protein